MKLYSIKTFYRSKAKGKPNKAPKGYRIDSQLIEERVVLFKARTESEAIQKAEKEARSYSKYSYKNPFGQIVETDYLGYCDVYEIIDEIESGVEVFSTTDVLRGNHTKKSILKMRMGDEDTLSDKSRSLLRSKFLNREFTPTAQNYIEGKTSNSKG